ncbi:MAG: helix-turn-helix transcriptional regulator [Rhizobiales bacterium]|nr:helix-turn-helix transcriptional regulator [Hyphomicrobiales bacterium]
MSADLEQQPRSVPGRHVVDWRMAAELLARGLTVAEAARQIGCSRSQLSRRRNHDRVFRAWVEDCEASLPPLSERRICSLRQRLHDAIDAEVQSGNVRVILWLADRLKLIQPAAREPSASSLQYLLGAMTDQDIKEFESLKD